MSFSKSWGLDFWKGLTLANYKFILFEYDVTQRAILNSLMPRDRRRHHRGAARRGDRLDRPAHRIPGRKLLDYAALIPLGLPGIVMAVALIQFWLAMPLALYGTLAILLLAYVGRYIPLGVRAANASLRQIDPSLEESARILGASWGMTMREVTLPLIRPGLFAGWLLVFVPVIQELSRLDPAVQLELDHPRGRGLQSLRDRLHRAGRGARHDQHGDHRRRDLARRQARRRRHREPLQSGTGSGVVMAGITIKDLTKSFGGGDDAPRRSPISTSTSTTTSSSRCSGRAAAARPRRCG